MFEGWRSKPLCCQSSLTFLGNQSSLQLLHQPTFWSESPNLEETHKNEHLEKEYSSLRTAAAGMLALRSALRDWWLSGMFAGLFTDLTLLLLQLQHLHSEITDARAKHSSLRHKWINEELQPFYYPFKVLKIFRFTSKFVRLISDGPSTPKDKCETDESS